MRQLKITKSITNRESQSLDKYLQEIGKVDLLTPDEEVTLAQRIRDGAAPSDVGHAAGGQDGVASLQVMEAVRQSLTTGAPVAVAPACA